MQISNILKAQALLRQGQQLQFAVEGLQVWPAPERCVEVLSHQPQGAAAVAGTQACLELATRVTPRGASDQESVTHVQARTVLLQQQLKLELQTSTIMTNGSAVQ